MSKIRKEIDWSEGEWKIMLERQRRYMWPEDSVLKFARWLGLHHGFTAVDIGCGLGYLGYTYWPYFGRRGKYYGIDHSLKLLRQASQAARGWAKGGKAVFLTGDAYHLPFEDNFADWVMCQTILMHLVEPERALKEMIRILKPGGLIMCDEPDNVASGLARGYFSVPEMKLEDQLLFNKMILLANKGRIRLGRGDNSIGSRLPHLLTNLGMTDIGVRMNDEVFYLEPPYDDPRQKHRFEGIKRNMFDPKIQRFWLKKNREEFLTGGGKPEEFDRLQKLTRKYRTIYKKQIENRSLAMCGGTLYYITKGRKPMAG
nr:class I SAM-dependent methyltransferase [candidate division Zixibacteria bacterium]